VGLIDVDVYNIPRFRLKLETINFGLLMSKAVYIQAEYDGFNPHYETKKEQQRRLHREKIEAIRKAKQEVH
jgi:hypothetical protein